MENDDKKGFAGFSKLASDIVVEVPDEPKLEEAAKESEPNQEQVESSTSKANFIKKFFNRKNKPAIVAPKPTGKQGNYWWLVLPLIAVLTHLNDGDKKTPPSHTSAPVSASQSQATAKVVTPAVVTTAAANSPSMAGLPVPANYHPHITTYLRGPVFVQFRSLIDAGKGISEDDFQKFSTAASAGDLDAQYIVATLTKYGHGTPKSDVGGDMGLLGAAQNGQPDALRDFGYSLKNDTRKIDYWMRAALLGDDKSQFLVAQNYYNGKVIEKDYGKAMYWFAQSAERYNSDSMLAIAMLYSNGYGTPKDDEKAFYWEMKSAKEDNANACAAVATDYSQSLGVTVNKDLGKAFYWLSCSDSKDQDVKNLRTSVEANMTEENYITAAQLGSREAMVKLAKDYHLGTNVLKNNFTAEKYMQEYGFKDTPELQKLENDIQSEMTPDEIKNAQDQGVGWLAGKFKEIDELEKSKKSALDNRSDPIYREEITPSVGSVPVLTKEELRWCEYQRRRIDYITHEFPDDKNDTNSIAKLNLKYLTKDISNKYDAVIADANARCPVGRQFYENDMNAITAELKDPIYLNRIALDAQQIMLKWDQRFWFRD